MTITADTAITATFEVLVARPVVDGAFSSGIGAANATSVSFSHTAGSGSDRLLLVGVSWNCGSTNRTISSVTFGGTAMTEVLTQIAGTTTSNPRYSAIYALVNPASGASGQVVVTFSGAVTNGIVAGAANFAGVDQATPLGTPNGAASTSSQYPSVDLTGLTGNELIFDNVFQGGSSTQTLTPGGGQTGLWNALVSNARGAGSTKEASAGSNTMSWTAGSASYFAIVAVPIRPAP